MESIKAIQNDMYNTQRGGATEAFGLALEKNLMRVEAKQMAPAPLAYLSARGGSAWPRTEPSTSPRACGMWHAYELPARATDRDARVCAGGVDDACVCGGAQTRS